MAVIQIGIIGLGRVGASVALAVKRYQQAEPGRQTFTVAGYDQRPELARAAKASGAFDEITGSLIAAARQKDVIVLALPFADVQTAYELLVGELKPGAVVLDFSPLAVPSLKWAQPLEGSDVHLVGVTPVLNAAYLFDGRDDAGHAAGDLFTGGVLLLSPAVKAHPEAVALAASFAVVLGAEARFVDPHEHDGWQGSVELLPALLGVTGFMAARTLEGWDEARQITNPNFGRLTHLLADGHPDDLRVLLLQNREAALRAVDAELAVLGEVRQALAASDTHALAEAFEDAFSAYNDWLAKRMVGQWDEAEASKRGAQNDAILSSFLGGYLARKLRGKRDSEE